MIPDPRTKEGMLELHELLKKDSKLMDGILEALTGDHIKETRKLGTPLWLNPYFEADQMWKRKAIEQNLLLILGFTRNDASIARAVYSLTSLVGSGVLSLENELKGEDR